jgi:small subunit ribosomal protein S9
MFAEGREPDTPEEETPESGAPGPEIEGADALSAAAGEAAEAPAEGEDAPAEEPAAEEAPAEEAPAEEAPAEEAPAENAPAEETPEPAPAAEGEAAEGESAEGESAEQEAPAAEGEDASREHRGRKDREDKPKEEEVIPGMHLEPDLVLEEKREESEYGQYGESDSYGDDEAGEEGDTPAAEPEPVAYTPLDLAADARYGATGKRKSAVARVILKPGEGTYSINGRHLDEYFPRVRLQRVAQQPLEAAGYSSRMDVVARIHGGGVAAQATALRHGIARALVEADPALRGELKRRGYLTRDPRVKERKKAGLKKARKRPQFSKR